MVFATKKCIKCGQQFVVGGIGIATEPYCDTCSPKYIWVHNAKVILPKGSDVIVRTVKNKNLLMFQT